MRKITLLKAGCFIFLGMIGGLFLLHSYFLDGLDGILFELLYERDTAVYALGYTDRAFRQIKQSMTSQEVLSLLGVPLEEQWYYRQEQGTFRIWFDKEYVGDDPFYFYTTEKTRSSVQKGMTKTEVLNLLGNPTKKYWIYSKSSDSGSYRVRVIILRDDKVAKKIHEFYVD